MKIKHKNKQHWGKPLNIPYDGEVLVGKAGVTEVSEQAAKTLLTKSPDWEEIPGQKSILTLAKGKKPVGKSAPKKAVKVEEPEDDEEEDFDEEEQGGAAADSDDDSEPESEETDTDGLDDMDLDNLVNIAQTSEIQGWEKFQHNERALRTYLKNRLKA